jgi:hypothetical protein
MRNGKDMDTPIRDMSGDAVKQFWAKVTKGNGCWEFQGWADPKGYRHFQGSLAHRFAYEQVNGPIPSGALLDHLCWNRGCVNPEHLRAVSDAQNQQNRAGANGSSKSGLRGVYYVTATGRWRAEATLNYKRYSLGHHDTKEEAHAAVTQWRREHMQFSEQDKPKKVA